MLVYVDIDGHTSGMGLKHLLWKTHWIFIKCVKWWNDKQMVWPWGPWTMMVTQVGWARMTSWSAHGKVCPSQLTDGANLHHTATMEQTMEHTAMVHIGEHRCRQSRVGEMDEDNLRMREEVSTPLVHFRTHSHAHQQVCEKLKGL